MNLLTLQESKNEIMPEVIVRYKTKKALQALLDFAKHLDIIIEPVGKKKTSKKSLTNIDLPVRIAEKPDVNALSGIWKEHPVTLNQLREKAWGDRI